GLGYVAASHMDRRMAMRRWFVMILLVNAVVAPARGAGAQQARTVGSAASREPARADSAVTLPEGFVIGPDDVLSIVFWRDKDMSTQVTVRPDGKISLPLLDEVQAAGLTPAALRAYLAAESKRFFENPNVTVVVAQINSRK